MSDVSLVGRTAAGVKGISLGAGDAVVAAFAHNSEGEIVLATDRGYMKRCLFIDFERQARGGKGLKCITLLKNGSNGGAIADAVMVQEPYDLIALQKTGTTTKLNTEDIAIETRASKGAPYVLAVMNDEVTKLYRCW